MAVNFFQHIDVYCERTDASFWSEPLNAISNLAFIIAAYFAYRAYRTYVEISQKTSLILIAFMVIIGLGSFVFHTFANRLTGLMDVVPIGLTILLFYGFTLSNVFNMKWWAVIVAFAYFPFGYMVITLPVFNDLGASIMYVPALVMIIGFAIMAMMKDIHSAHFLIMAFLTFTASLLFRTADSFVCDHFAIGTHYMWHILNALTLYLCLRFYMQGRIN
jgi:hypothetical protein